MSDSKIADAYRKSEAFSKKVNDEWDPVSNGTISKALDGLPHKEISIALFKIFIGAALIGLVHWGTIAFYSALPRPYNMYIAIAFAIQYALIAAAVAIGPFTSGKALDRQKWFYVVTFPASLVLLIFKGTMLWAETGVVRHPEGKEL